ncbi:hypothetical protein FBU59_000249 [Linderina macrospora]|uniref:Uncharacterized protein n=1 Tax=Linderina macrospora TaxID=4868 RepID=A0ACC1JH69_9FUNG|nr:hypothetical protein FBU59_000249 [Linderina macrospora]
MLAGLPTFAYPYTYALNSIHDVEKRGVKTRSYAVDFSRCSEKQWSDIDKLVNSEQVNILSKYSQHQLGQFAYKH